jgi:hypothetical protein
MVPGGVNFDETFLTNIATPGQKHYSGLHLHANDAFAPDSIATIESTGIIKN